MSRDCWGENRAGLRIGSAVGLARGIQPLETHKSTVADPRPSRFGASLLPCAKFPWHDAQFSSNNVSPVASWVPVAWSFCAVNKGVVRRDAGGCACGAHTKSPI